MPRLNDLIKRHKDKNPMNLNNNVIYRISCKTCDASYVGQTKRQLSTQGSQNTENIYIKTYPNILLSPTIY